MNKKLDDMSTEELLEELRKSQGDGDALMEFGGGRAPRITTGKSKTPHQLWDGAERRVYGTTFYKFVISAIVVVLLSLLILSIVF